MTTNFPGTADDPTNLPDVTGWDQSGHNVVTNEYDENRVHSRFLGVIRTAILAIEDKLGTGAGTPLANRLLRGTAAGVTEWVVESVIPVTNWGKGTGTPGQALVVKGDGSGLEFSSSLSDSLQSHLGDVDDAHDASAVSSVPTGTLSATTVQAALNELDTEKETPAGAQAKVDTHSADTTDVHGIANTAALETQTGAQARVDAAIAALLDSAPGALDTLNELAAAIGDDPNFATTMVNSLALRVRNDQPAAATSDVKDVLVAKGLLADAGATPLNLDGGTLTAGMATIGGALDHDGTTAGFYGTAPVARPALPDAATVTAADIRAALIALGLCT